MKCDKKMSLEDCELLILRNSVDKIERNQKLKKLGNPDIDRIIDIVETFLRNKKRMCYGGTAVNNILPREVQFYDRSTQFPDYDFFSPDPIKDCIQLSNTYYKEGFTEVEAKAALHVGTYKVFVNSIPVADITFMTRKLYHRLHKKGKRVAGIHYAPPNFLRMSMYLELSRPRGDVSRWEKVYKRLMLLNKYHPLKGKQCNFNNIQRAFNYDHQNIHKNIPKSFTRKNFKTKSLMKIDKMGKEKINKSCKYGKNNNNNNNKNKNKNNNNNKKSCKSDTIPEATNKDLTQQIFTTVKEVITNNNGVFFGAYANKMYLRRLKAFKKKQIPQAPDFDVLSETPQILATIIKEELDAIGVKDVIIKRQKAVDEIISTHYQVLIKGQPVCFIYEPMSCHSYNDVMVQNRKIRVATIDTMLSFYLAFIYADKPYYNPERILCMCDHLYTVRYQNRLKIKGILKRFNDKCYGKQKTMGEMRMVKTKKFKELKSQKGSKMWDRYFFKYQPTATSTRKPPSPHKPYRVPRRNTRHKRRRYTNRNKTRKRGLFRFF